MPSLGLKALSWGQTGKKDMSHRHRELLYRAGVVSRVPGIPREGGECHLLRVIE